MSDACSCNNVGNSCNDVGNNENFIEVLQETLDEVDSTGTFAVGGKVDSLPLPGLVVKNVGAIALPLQPAQSKVLAQHSDQAPFGRGADTVVDTSVRFCRQVDASAVELSPAWDMSMQELARRHAVALGACGAVRASLYKLVLYEDGGFFKAHKDTEKEPGMFGSMVVQLPALHGAGTLSVRHRGEEKRFDFSQASDAYFFSAAFYTDCEHELYEVKNGSRLCLLYNLIRIGIGPVPSLADRDAIAKNLAKAARLWEKSGEQRKLCVLLEHQYTEKNMAFCKLKGHDKARVDALREVELFDLYLALIERHKIGSAEYNPYYHRSFGWDENEDIVMEDCYEDNISVIKWVDLNDKEVSLSGLDIDVKSDMLSGESPFDSDDDPDHEDYEGYTGNAGPTIDYFYHRAVLVIWPRSFTFSITCNADFRGAVQLAQQRASSGSDDAERTLLDVVEYAHHHLRIANAHLAELLYVACMMKHEQAILNVIGLLARSLSPPDNSHSSSYCRPAKKIGCSSAELAEVIHTAIKLLGWSASSTRVLAAIAVTPPDGLHHVAAMALTLEADPSLKKAAGAVAMVVANMMIGLHRLHDGSAVKVAEMLFSIPGCEAQRATFVKRAGELSAATLANVLKIVSQHGQVFPEGFDLLCNSYFGVAFHGSQMSTSKNHAATIFVILLKLKDDSLQSSFTCAVLRSKDPTLLQALTQAPAIAAEIGNFHVRNLASARAEQLMYPKPEFSHRQPLADVPAHPKVTHFLRGDSTSMTYSAFNGIGHARNFANKHFGRCNYNPIEKHSARATAGGRGGTAYVEITKTDGAFKVQTAQYKRDQLELQLLQPLLDKHVADGNDTKKRRKLKKGDGSC